MAELLGSLRAVCMEILLWGAQQAQLKRGVDIVWGTPGRVKDHIERGNIDFRSLKFRVLDEVDEMLKIGFVDDVEFILGKVEDASLVQTVLFSATLPVWVKHIASKFLKPDKKTADLVGNEKMKASKNVRHIIIGLHFYWPIIICLTFLFHALVLQDLS
uniref:RNA helicase n=2 Tax=Solanum chacoense TaxID=4108 RepID=A0A0V0GVN7_SOLCH